LAKQYNGPPLNLLVDQGTADTWHDVQLKADNFINACTQSNLPLVYRKQDGYDHGYFFVSTFIEEHIKHHARVLNQV